jgi:hypothetical protein
MSLNLKITKPGSYEGKRDFFDRGDLAISIRAVLGVGTSWCASDAYQ